MQRLRPGHLGLAALGLLALTACDGSPGASNTEAATDATAPSSPPPPAEAPTPIPAFQASFVPSAPGRGNFEVCLGADAADNGVTRASVPARMIFQSWGQLTGDLRQSAAYDTNALSGGPANRAKTSYAVVLTEPVVLTPARPCRVTVANAVTHGGFGFSHDLVPVELHLSFQADSLMETADQDITNGDSPGDKMTTDALGMGLVNGTPVADIEHVRRLRAGED